MKYLSITIALGCVFFSINVYSQKNMKNVIPSQIDCNIDNLKCAETRTKNLEIKRICKIKNVYVLYGIDDKKHVFTILSQKNTSVKNCKIKEGNVYKFFLIPYLDRDLIPDADDLDYSICGGDPKFKFYIIVNNKVIKIETDGQDVNFYGSPNLNGVYYIPYDGSEENKTYPYFRSHCKWLRNK